MEEKTEMTNSEKTVQDKLLERTEHLIELLLDEGIRPDNADYLYKLVDIHKDIENEKYWKIKKEDISMRYRNYGESYNGYGEYSEGSYGRRGVKGTGRGRYRGGRGSGRYRGEELMDEMMFHYGNYSEGGQYGAEGETMEALSSLMESAYEYFKALKENANSQDEVKMMEHYFKKMGDM